MLLTDVVTGFVAEISPRNDDLGTAENFLSVKVVAEDSPRLLVGVMSGAVSCTNISNLCFMVINGLVFGSVGVGGSCFAFLDDVGVHFDACVVDWLRRHERQERHAAAPGGRSETFICLQA